MGCGYGGLSWVVGLATWMWVMHGKVDRGKLGRSELCRGFTVWILTRWVTGSW